MLRKVFICFFLLFAFDVKAKFEKVEIIDSSLQKAVLKEAEISKKDIKIYQDIFADIRENKIEEADALIKKLKNDALMGHVLAQKYLSAKYVSSYDELKKWLKKYSRLPQQRTIDNLAKVKAPGYKAPPKKVVKKTLYAPYAWYKESYSQLKPDDRKFVRAQAGNFQCRREQRSFDNQPVEFGSENAEQRFGAV